ncbi:unnamed protein product, partial [Mesocestoides corti]|uniref:Cystatin domain-containing protein n=1 Tax=Mesocestoides corti TaxID=53468 RepID=A0A0R3UMX0_MESCO
MKWLTVLLLTYLTAVSFGCKLADRESDDQDLGRYSERRIVGGQSTMSREGMNDSMFQEALAEVLKKLDDANECHNFQLVYVKEAKQQVVAGMKYVMTLVVKPIYSGDSSENCRGPCFTDVDGNKEVTAEALVQVWKEPKHYISFKNPRDAYTDFNEDGEILINCSGDPDLLTSQPSDMSPEELKTLQFQAAVQQSIDKLNDEAKCFYYVLDRI